MNVLALRYDGEHFIFDPRIIGGRSHCPHCGKTLGWRELVPVLSFLAQGGKCRHCRARISFQYPVVELLSAAVFAAVPWRFAAYPLASPWEWWVLSGLWILALEIIILVAVIDIRLRIVPDELNVALGAVALFETLFVIFFLQSDYQSFFGRYADLFGIYGNPLGAHFAGAVIAGGFFWLLVVVTPLIFHQEGMGMGDVKLALPLGLLFGWPDILLLGMAAFVAGAAVGVLLIASGAATRRSAVPFVPFLAFAAAFVFFAGFPSVDWYFRIIGL